MSNEGWNLPQIFPRLRWHPRPKSWIIAEYIDSQVPRGLHGFMIEPGSAIRSGCHRRLFKRWQYLRSLEESPQEWSTDTSYRRCVDSTDLVVLKINPDSVYHDVPSGYMVTTCAYASLYPDRVLCWKWLDR